MIRVLDSAGSTLVEWGRQQQQQQPQKSLSNAWKADELVTVDACVQLVMSMVASVATKMEVVGRMHEGRSQGG